MNERKLTPEQIEELFVFCRNHYVPQYDLQLELVDHMAVAIEEQLDTQPDLTFREALSNTFGKFGIFGFSKIKVNKEKELRHKYNRLLFQYLIDFYRLPKILMTLTLSILLYLIFRLTNDVQLVTVAFTVIISLILVSYHFLIFKKYFDLKPYPKKPFMILDCLRDRQAMISGAFQLPWLISKIIHILNDKYINHPEIEFFFAFFLIGFTILLYLYFFVVPQIIKQHFTEQFPQFVKS